MTRPGMSFVAKLAAVTGIGFVLRVIGLASYLPTRDDLLAVWTADFYMTSGQPYPIMPFHPVLRNVLTWLSHEVFGRGAVGAKAPSVLLGTLLIAAVGMLVRATGRSERVALIAAAFVALDPLLIDYSRQVIQEVHAACFGVVGAWLAAEYMRQDELDRQDEKDRWWLLPLAGLAFGLGTASKAYVFAPLLVSGGMLAARAWRRRSAEEGAFLVGSLVAVPFMVYLLTYLPWFGRGYDLGEWFAFQAATFQAMVMHTKPLVGFFANSRPALWFVVPLYSYADFAMTRDGAQLAIGVGNPITWLAVLPAVGYLLASRERRRRDALPLALFLASYLPLAGSPRPVWLLSAVAVVPFAMMIVASAVDDAIAVGRKRVAAAYLVAVLVGAALLYPAATGSALRFQHLRPLVRTLGLQQTHGFEVDR